MMRKHVRVDMPVLESIGASTAGGVRRLIIDADAVELDGALALGTLKPVDLATAPRRNCALFAALCKLALGGRGPADLGANPQHRVEERHPLRRDQDRPRQLGLKASVLACAPRTVDRSAWSTE